MPSTTLMLRSLGLRARTCRCLMPPISSVWLCLTPMGSSLRPRPSVTARTPGGLKAMPIQVLMPALSPTMTEGKLARWLKKEGDAIESGDVLAEIETDKATMEVEAVEEGTLGKILVEEGTEGVAVNAPIALLLEEGEDEAALDKGATQGE